MINMSTKNNDKKGIGSITIPDTTTYTSASGLKIDNSILTADNISTNPISTDPFTISPVTLNLSSNTNFEDRWEFYDSEDVTAIRNSIKIQIKQFNDNPENPSDKVIRRLAENYKVFWGSLKKFVRKDDGLSKTVAHKLFKDLVKVFDGVNVNNPENSFDDIVSFMEIISNKNVDAIIIDYHYPAKNKITDYKENIIERYRSIRNAWISYWNEYKPDPISEIELLDKFQSKDSIENLFKSNDKDKLDVKYFYRQLPSFTQRRISKKILERFGKKEDETIRIGYFLMVFKWSSFFTDEEGNLLLDQNNNPIENEDEKISFFRSPSLEHLILKNDEIDE